MERPPIGYRNLRKGRVSEVGRLYLITKSCKERLSKEATPAEQIERGRLVESKVPEIILGSLDWLQQRKLITLMAYCLMPDHLHLLFQLGESASLQNVMRRFSSFTGLETYRETKRGHLWEEGYHDHALRDDAKIEPFVIYVEQNPVKAGLVDNAEDWPWSSCSIR
jgi:REP element-mobilizing transposase RayT